MADADFHDAVYYRLQCISEATRNLLLVDPGIVERYAEIPWMRVRAIGNVIRHEYGEIESSAVWATISGSGLRNLVSVANRELVSLEP